MNRRFMILGLAMTTVAACTSGQATQLGPDGLPLPKLYRISPNDVDAISFRMLDGVNSLRAASGAAPLTFSAQLNAAAATHSRDMHIQNRPWHFGSDGSSPIDRAKRVGYFGRIIGENISETYETEIETLSAWMAQPDTRAVILDPDARQMGFSWFQEDDGKIWWTLVTGA